MNERHPSERPTSKDFHLKVERVDAERGHVYIADGPVVWKWFWDKQEDDPMKGRVLLLNGSESSIPVEKRMAMKDQVFKIMRERLEKTTVTEGQTSEPQIL